MPTATQPKNLGDLLKYEASSLYSREQATVAAAQNLSLGTVVGRDATTAKLKAYDHTAADGTEIAIGVLANDVDATLSDRSDALLIARHAIVARTALVWLGDTGAEQQAVAIGQLAERGVLVRDSV